MGRNLARQYLGSPNEEVVVVVGKPNRGEQHYALYRWDTWDGILYPPKRSMPNAPCSFQGIRREIEKSHPVVVVGIVELEEWPDTPLPYSQWKNLVKGCWWQTGYRLHFKDSRKREE